MVLTAVEEGCYEAQRASGLSGVPLSTVYHWARTGVVVPSVSPTREMLWSYADLMTLRIVSWLRHPKRPHGGAPVPASPMHRVRKALGLMADRGLDPWTADADRPSPIVVDRGGTIFLRDAGSFVDAQGAPLLDLPEDSLDLLAPFSVEASLIGPDLVRPRPDLRIVPAKVAGEPHVERTRITSRTLAALAQRGIPMTTVSTWYGVRESSVEQALDLERQITGARPTAA